MEWVISLSGESKGAAQAYFYLWKVLDEGIDTDDFIEGLTTPEEVEFWDTLAEEEDRIRERWEELRDRHFYE